MPCKRAAVKWIVWRKDHIYNLYLSSLILLSSFSRYCLRDSSFCWLYVAARSWAKASSNICVWSCYTLSVLFIPILYTYSVYLWLLAIIITLHEDQSNSTMALVLSEWLCGLCYGGVLLRYKHYMTWRTFFLHSPFSHFIMHTIKVFPSYFQSLLGLTLFLIHLIVFSWIRSSIFLKRSLSLASFL